jgi:hypothetical protein
MRLYKLDDTTLINLDHVCAITTLGTFKPGRFLDSTVFIRMSDGTHCQVKGRQARVLLERYLDEETLLSLFGDQGRLARPNGR